MGGVAKPLGPSHFFLPMYFSEDPIFHHNNLTGTWFEVNPGSKAFEEAFPDRSYL